MITYDRSIRQTIHATLRRICGPVDGARGRVEGNTPLYADNPAALACLGASCRRRTPAPASRKRRFAGVAGAVIVASALIAPLRPAQAQDAVPASLYLPAILAGRTWFTEAELEAAQIANGFDPEQAAMHTNCSLDASANPPAVMRFTSCNQYYVDGQPTEEDGTPLWFYWKNFADPAVSSALISAATGADAQAAAAASCYMDADGVEVCG